MANKWTAKDTKTSLKTKWTPSGVPSKSPRNFVRDARDNKSWSGRGYTVDIKPTKS